MHQVYIYLDDGLYSLVSNRQLESALYIMVMNEQDLKLQSLLQSATEVFAAKGFTDATVSEIARGAGMSPSGVYNYYSSKEQILFAIIDEFLQMSLQFLTEHLEGLKGAENKLRKTIWCHCKVMTTHRKQAAIVLEARSYSKLYSSPAFDTLKKYTQVIMGIIEEGMAEGSIRRMATPRLIRDMIYGAIDDMTYNWLNTSSPSPLEQAEALCEMIVRAIRPLAAPLAEELDPRREKLSRILEMATTAFARKGYHGVSITEIAKEAGVSEGSVYEYFHTKENLLNSIPAIKLGRLLAYINGQSPEKQLKRTILDLFAFYSENRDYTTILVLMLRANKSFINSEGYLLYEKIFSVIAAIVQRGQSEGIFLADLDLKLFQSIVYGTIDHVIIPWVIFSRRYNLMALGEEAGNLIISAIQT